LEASEALLEVDLDRLELIIVQVDERRINLVGTSRLLCHLSSAVLAPPPQQIERCVDSRTPPTR
jgi:hypothetical protein